jgi:hypothetical protein
VSTDAGMHVATLHGEVCGWGGRHPGA